MERGTPRVGIKFALRHLSLQRPAKTSGSDRTIAEMKIQARFSEPFESLRKPSR